MCKLLVFDNRDKCTENNLCNFRVRIAYTEKKIERKISLKKGKIGPHLKKWSTYLLS